MAGDRLPLLHYRSTPLFGQDRLKGYSVLSYLELVELAHGDIVLQRSEGDEQPLVTIRFSDETRKQIPGSCLELARVMAQAGLDAAQIISDDVEDDVDDDEDAIDGVLPQSKTVH